MVQMPRGATGTAGGGVTAVVAPDAPVSARGTTVPAETLDGAERSAVVVVDGRVGGGAVARAGARDAGALAAPGPFALGAPAIGVAGVGGALAVAVGQRAP